MSSQMVIVVPCYNEATRLDPAPFIDFIRANADISLIFVNDGSTDNTMGVLNKIVFTAPEGKVHILDLKNNAGKAEAVREGFLKAFYLNPAYIGFIDADLAAPLECLHDLRAVLIKNRKDIAVGSRIALLGWHVERSNIRHYLGRVFATMASMVLSLRIYDTQCGAKLFRVTDRLKRVFMVPFTVKWIFDVEILARFIITEQDGQPPTADICMEYPLPVWIDKKGSKLKLGDFITSAVDLFRIARMIRRKALPR